MKVAFLASSASKDEVRRDLKLISELIKKLGHEYYELYGYSGETLTGIMTKSEKEKNDLYEKWLRIVEAIDVAVAEVSMPGTINLGACIGGLIEKGKPTLLMYKKGFKPTLVTELYQSKVIITEYTTENLEEMLTWGINELELLLTHRFTMNLNAKLDYFVLNQARKLGISRSDYIRGLIEDRMKGK